jgi:hypothetical protein
MVPKVLGVIEPDLTDPATINRPFSLVPLIPMTNEMGREVRQDWEPLSTGRIDTFKLGLFFHNDSIHTRCNVEPPTMSCSNMSSQVESSQEFPFTLSALKIPTVPGLDHGVIWYWTGMRVGMGLETCGSQELPLTSSTLEVGVGVKMILEEGFSSESSRTDVALVGGIIGTEPMAFDVGLELGFLREPC